jgi:hypothetical protein
MNYHVYCLYAAMKDEDPSPWMIAAEDEYSWEGDPDRCEAVFAEARKQAESAGYVVREITLIVDISAIYKAFEPVEVPTTTEEASSA